MINLNERTNLAIKMASRAHQGQYRKGGDIPYISHPFAVAMISQRYIDDEDVFIACLLHDVLEDVPAWKYSRDDILRDFGEQVTALVDDVSEPVLNNNIPVFNAWMLRKKAYLSQLQQTKNDKSFIVSLSDKIHNMHEMALLYQKNDGAWRNFAVDQGREVWFFEEVFKILDTKHIPEAARGDYLEALEALKRLI